MTNRDIRGADSADVMAAIRAAVNPAIDRPIEGMIKCFLFALGLVGESLPPGKNENSEACR